MIKTIIIDDEPLARSIVKEYLENYNQISIIEECNDGFEGVKAISEHHPDLIFLDIQMPKINGFEMLELLDYTPDIIFTTAFDEYALKAFETHAVDYLLKPFSQERFDQAMQKWQTRNQQEKHTAKIKNLLDDTSQQEEQLQRVVVKTGNKIRIIPIHDILYFEADDDYVKLHTADGSFLKKKTMSSFEKSLNTSHYVRTHRSYIVQIQQITRIEPYEKDSHVAILKSGVKIPISKAGYAKLKSVLDL